MSVAATAATVGAAAVKAKAVDVATDRLRGGGSSKSGGFKYGSKPPPTPKQVRVIVSKPPGAVELLPVAGVLLALVWLSRSRR